MQGQEEGKKWREVLFQGGEIGDVHGKIGKIL